MTIIQQIARWQIKTFHNVTPQKAREKLNDELSEFDEATGLKEKSEEIADVAFMLIELAWTLDIDIEQAMRDKLELNKLRSWNEENGKYQHKCDEVHYDKRK